MSRRLVILLEWAFLLASIALLGFGVLEAWRAATETASAMHRVGWSRYIRRPPKPAASWLIGCALTPECREVFIGEWRRAYPLWVPVAWMASLYAAGILRVLAEGMRGRSRIPPGAARWAARGEMRHLIKGEKGSPLRGYVGLLASSGNPTVLRLPERLRCSHCLVVGGSGARKTTGYHKPNVLLDATDGVSVVLFDLKYPDPKSGFWDCVPYFAARGYDVQLFLPYEAKTLIMPLLGDVQTLEDAYDVVDMVLPPPLREHPANFYRDQERQLLVALVLGVVLDHLRPTGDPHKGQASLRRIFRLCLSGIREVERYIHTHPDRRVREAAAGLFELEERLLAGIAAGVAGRLQLFNDDRFERATTPVPEPRHMVQLSRIGEAPTLLYIGIPQEKVQGGRGQVVLQLVKRAIEKALMQTADRHGGQLPRHVSVYLDEFAAMGPLPHVSEVMATMRSRRVAYHLSLQNRAQGEQLYGPTGFRSFFVNNIQTVVIFPRYLKFDDARYFSEVLGYMTVEQRSVGTTHRAFEVLGGSRTDWLRDVLRPLLPPEEYPDWPEAMGILFTTGVRPVKALFPRLDEDAVCGVKNPLVGFRRYVFPSLAVGSSEAGRQKMIDFLMRHHFEWVDRNFPGIRDVLGDARPLWEQPPAPPLRPGAPPTYRNPVHEPAEGASSGERAEDVPFGTSEPAKGEDKAGPGAAQQDLVDSLREWVGQVARLDLPPEAVRVYLHNRRPTRLGIHRVALPAELSAPPRLVEWMAQRWVRVTPSEIALLPRSFRLLPREHLASIRRASRRQRQHPSIPPEASDTAPGVQVRHVDAPAPEGSVGAMEALMVLRAWVDAHGANLEGHPDRIPDAEVLGSYEEGRAVALLPEVVTRILREAGIPEGKQKALKTYWRDVGWIRVSPGHLTTRRKIGGRRRRVVEILWATGGDAGRQATS